METEQKIRSRVELMGRIRPALCNYLVTNKTTITRASKDLGVTIRALENILYSGGSEIFTRTNLPNMDTLLRVAISLGIKP